MTTNTPSQAASIDTPEFKALMNKMMGRLRTADLTGYNLDVKAWWDSMKEVIANIDAKLAQAWNDGYAAGMTLMRETIQKSLCDEFGVPHIEGPEQTYIMVEAAIKERIEALQVRAECAEECFAKLTASDNEWRDRANILEARLGEVMEKRDEFLARAIAAESRAEKAEQYTQVALGIKDSLEARLAEIHRGVEGLEGLTDTGQFIDRDEVLALLATQGQADTSDQSDDRCIEEPQWTSEQIERFKAAGNKPFKINRIELPDYTSGLSGRKEE